MEETRSDAADPVDPSPLSSRLLGWADRRRWWLFGFVALLYLAGFNGQWRVSPDSALYASLGRSIAEGRGYTYQGEHHKWVEPALPYVIGYGFRLFGPDAFWPTMSVLLASAFAALALFYRLITVHAGRPTAVVLTVLLALNESFYRYPFHLFTDMPFLVGVLLFLLGYEFLYRDEDRRRSGPWLLMGLGTLVMVSTRPAFWTFLAALFAAVAWHVLRGPTRLRIRHVVIAALVVACILAFRAVDPRRKKVGEASVIEGRMSELVLERTGFMARRTLTQMVPLMFEEVGPEAIYGSRIVPGINTLVTLATLALGVGLVFRRPLWGLFAGATVAQMLVHLPRERYFLPILPLLLYALWLAALWLERRLTRPWSAVAFAAVLVLADGINFFVIIGDVIEQHRRPFLAHFERGLYQQLSDLARRLPEAVSERDVVIAEQDRVLSYFSRRKCLPPLTARRWPAGEAEWRQFRSQLETADHVYVVLPGRHTEELITKMPLEVEQSPVLTEGKWTVHRARVLRKSGTGGRPGA
jgi:4-amino-4-deoxy-L-arabinose transferase-like glycosyltransferase